MATEVPQEFTLENETHRPLVREILEALKNLKYGTVEIVVHDGRVVQIDRHDRRRFPITARV
jgi:hypothetical protein